MKEETKIEELKAVIEKMLAAQNQLVDAVETHSKIISDLSQALALVSKRLTDHSLRSIH